MGKKTTDDLEEIENENEFDEEMDEESSKGKKDKNKAKEKVLPKLEDLAPQVRFVITKIQEYLENEAKVDELFAKKYPNDKKSLVECWVYIGEQVRKDQSKYIGGAVHSSTIFRYARDYYNDDVKVESKNVQSGTLMTETAEEEKESNEILTDKEKKSIKDKAVKEYEEKVKKELEQQAKAEKEREEKIKAKELKKELIKKSKEEEKAKEKAKNKSFESIVLFDFND